MLGWWFYAVRNLLLKETIILGTFTGGCCNWSFSECDPMACPSVSAPSCRDDQFLVEVRGEKPCCYSYLCGKSSHSGFTPVTSPSFPFKLHTSFTSVWSIIPTKLSFLACVFCLSSVWVMYWTCSNLFTGRNPGCGYQQHLQLLSSLLLWWACLLVSMCASVTVSSKSCLHFLPCVGAVCDVNLCPESSVSCAPGLILVQAIVAGNCCPQYHCGTESHSCIHTHIHTLNHATASDMFWICV